MATTADAVVIGGGITGASALFHLCALGLRRVILCERRQPGAGATGKSGAFIQFHFCHNEAEVRLTQASLPYFQRWDELVGAGSCGFVPAGYLRLEPPDRVDHLRRRVELLRGLGIESSVVTPESVARLAPYLRLDGVAAAAFEPGSGYADAGATLAGLLTAARRRGAEVWQETAVTAVHGTDDTVSGVETRRGAIAAPVVIVAAGVWSAPLLQGVGLALPLRPMLTQSIFCSRPTSLPDATMTVGDGVSQSYFRRDGPAQILVGLGEGARRPLSVLDASDEPVPEAIVATARERLAARLHGADGVRPLGTAAGPIALTPDDLPIIDRHPNLRGLYYFAGDCGSSFKTAPAIGRALAEWAVLGQPRVADVSAFRLARFAALTGDAGAKPADA